MVLELIKSNNFKDAYKLLIAKEGVENYAREYNNARDLRASQVGKRENKKTKYKEIPVAKIPGFDALLNELRLSDSYFHSSVTRRMGVDL